MHRLTLIITGAIWNWQFADINFEEKAEEIFNTMIGMDYLDVLDENNYGFGTITIGE